jgi:glycogen synthase|tara:strand:- start:1545 stop:1664 length:120 start_codon:yes stop_codon:yes gene_type:complete
MLKAKLHSQEMKSIFNGLNSIMWNWEEKRKIFQEKFAKK